MKLSKEKRYKLIIKISRKFIQANVLKSYFQKTLCRYENKMERLIGVKRNEAVYQRFCDVNSKYWDEVEHDKNAGTLLVEGFFGESGPNYVVRVGTIAKALETVTKAKPLVLLRTGVKEEAFKKQIWSSFKMNDFIGIYEDIVPHLSKIKMKILTNFFYYYAKFLIFMKQHDKFINLSYKGVQFGDLLYDEITKINMKKTYTIKSIDKMDYNFFKYIIEGFLYSEYLWTNFDIKYYVTTHIQYIAYGLLVRFLRARKVPVLETTDDILFLYTEDEKNIVPKFHPYIHDLIKNDFDKVYNDEKLIQEAKQELNSRFDGSAEQIDVKMAYGDKNTYTETELRKKLGINNNNPIVYIFAHIFSDVPTAAGDFQLFPDYYIWIEETIKKCAQINHVNWIVKEHPSVDAYGERGEIAKIVEKYKKKDSTLFNCPEDFSTASVKETAKAIVTVRGTVGLEYSCVGIPTVLSAAAFYHGFGFTLEPQTKEEYFEQLKNIHLLTPLTEEQKRSALAVFKTFKLLNNTDFSIIDTQVKTLTWGNDGKQDVLAAFDLVSNRLEKIDPKTRPLYEQILKRFE